MLMREVILVPTYQRNALLHCCLRRLRGQDGDISIVVVADRGECEQETRDVAIRFNARIRVTPKHNYFGNSFSIMEAFRWACEYYDRIFICEDDTLAHPDCLAWHRSVHNEFDDIFASCGWVFNQHAPISDDLMFAPWYYAPNACFNREKLLKVVEHANPLYYNAMPEYVLKTFTKYPLPHENGRTNFYEQDAVIQHVLMEDGSQVAWSGVAKCSHIGTFGYNKPNGVRFEGTLEEQIAQIEEFIADYHARAETFGRPIVEREIGRELPNAARTWKIVLPSGWESTFRSERKRFATGEWINSVPMPREAKITLVP